MISCYPKLSFFLTYTVVFLGIVFEVQAPSRECEDRDFADDNVRAEHQYLRTEVLVQHGLGLNLTLFTY